MPGGAAARCASSSREAACRPILETRSPCTSITSSGALAVNAGARRRCSRARQAPTARRAARGRSARSVRSAFARAARVGALDEALDDRSRRSPLDSASPSTSSTPSSRSRSTRPVAASARRAPPADPARGAVPARRSIHINAWCQMARALQRSRGRAGAAGESRQEVGEPHEAPCRALVERRAGADDRRQRLRLLEAHDIFQQLGAERPRSGDPSRQPRDVPWRPSRVRHEVNDDATQARVKSAHRGPPREERREPDDERDPGQAPPRDAVGSEERPGVAPERQDGVVVQHIEHVQRRQRATIARVSRTRSGRERGDAGDRDAAAAKDAGVSGSLQSPIARKSGDRTRTNGCSRHRGPRSMTAQASFSVSHQHSRRSRRTVGCHRSRTSTGGSDRPRSPAVRWLPALAFGDRVPPGVERAAVPPPPGLVRGRRLPVSGNRPRAVSILEMVRSSRRSRFRYRIGIVRGSLKACATRASAAASGAMRSVRRVSSDWMNASTRRCSSSDCASACRSAFADLALERAHAIPQRRGHAVDAVQQVAHRGDALRALADVRETVHVVVEAASSRRSRDARAAAPRRCTG